MSSEPDPSVEIQEICQCEQVSHSPYGPVFDEESLVRVIVAPQHINPKTGEPTPAAFKKEELRDGGLSLLRLQYLDRSELERQSTLLLKGDSRRSVPGVLVGNAARVRELLDEVGDRAFCVVDDAQPDQPMHASIVRSGNQSDPEIKRLRGFLMDIFSPLVAVADAFD